MANKFVKSVLERQAIEAKRDKQNSRKAELEAAQNPKPTTEASTAVTVGDSIKAYAGSEAGIADVQSTPNEPMLAATLPNAADLATPPPQKQPSTIEEGAGLAANENHLPVPHAEATERTKIATAETVMQNNMSDLVSSYLIRTPERIAKNKTFYLDEAVINGIRAAAKKQKVTESKLVNDILRGVLGVH